MKLLEKEDLKLPEDLVVTADFVRHGGKLYKKGQIIEQVTGNDKAVLVATHKAVIKGTEEVKDKNKGKEKE